MEFLLFPTRFGEMGLGSEDGAVISRLYLPGQPMPRIASHETSLLTKGRREVLEYLKGERREFSVPLGPAGTPFQLKVWSALRAIPYGQIRSYRDIACAAGCPRGFRAVGMASHKNPIPILIPCHRVIAADGSLGGYAGGAEMKKMLLELEGQYF